MNDITSPRSDQPRVTSDSLRQEERGPSLEYRNTITRSNMPERNDYRSVRRY